MENNKEQTRRVTEELISDFADNSQLELGFLESDTYFKTIFENTGTAMLVVDNELNIVTANSVFKQRSEYPSNELIGKSFIQFVTPEFSDTVEKKLVQWQIVLGDAPLELEIKCIGKHNKVHDILITAAKLPDSKIIISLFDITEYKKAEMTMKHQVESQSMIIKISHDFTKAEAEDIDQLICFTLKQIGLFNNDDCCYVYLLSDDESTMSNAYEWRRRGIEATGNLRDLPCKNVSWWMEKLHNFENVYIPRASDLPPKARVEKNILQAQGAQSAIGVPIAYGNSLIGYLGSSSLCEKVWSKSSIYILNMVADFFAKALRQKKNNLALKESENYYRSIFENTGAATYIIEDDMTISKANREWGKSFGYSKEELEGAQWLDLFPENDKNVMKDYHRLRRIDSARVPKKYSSHITDKYGNIRDCLVAIDLIPGTSKSIATIADITEFNRINRALKATSAVNMAMLYAENEQSLLDNVCKNIVDIGGYRFAWVGYVDNDEEQTVLPVAHAGYEEGYLKILDIALKDNEKESGIVAMAIRNRELFICRNIEIDLRFAPWRKEAIKRSYNAVISIPLGIIKGGVRGALTIYSEDQDVFDDEEVKLLTEMAGNLAFGIKYLRARIERDIAVQDLEQSFKNMEKLFHQTVTSLEAIIRIRDPYTAEHQRRVADLSLAIATEMGLPEDTKTAVLIAASLHDIGKMNVPSDILNKPGKITELEFGIIKSHCRKGYEVIKNINFPWSIDEIILKHHERIDGSGYPLGLKGDEISMAVRILGVADVVEAMSSHRPYRPALGLDTALKEISRLKGKKYDANVVDACLHLFNNKGYILS
ncbi:MAG: HD domain-containing phosphohydrolase [Christensenellales bacterium]|jgi:PAS domain S-box-containing protein/putative nucleotidyltransferase with HDIG domain